MTPIGLLMMEHRLVDMMVDHAKLLLDHIETTGETDALSVAAAIDFMRTYADKTHHGKEEGILFRELARHKLSDRERSIMQELIAEHKQGRKMVGEMMMAYLDYMNGHEQAMSIILEKLHQLIAFYPLHIAKEDKVFFRMAMRHLSKAEQRKMVDEFHKFDREIIHKTYKLVAEEMAGMLKG